MGWAEQGLFRRFSDGHADRFSTKDGLPHQHIRDILREPDGTMWIATGLGLCRLVSNVRAGQSIVERVYTKKDGLMNEGIFSLFRASTGRLWIATMQGITEFVTDASPYIDTFVNYTREQGLSDAGIRTIAEDHDGNLWLGSESGGAMKISRSGFTSYSEADGLEHGRIAALGEDRDGQLFVVTGSLNSPSFHIHRFDGRRFGNFRVNTPAGVYPTWGWNQLFVEDRSRQWWVPTTSGLFQFPPVHTLDDLARVRPAKVYTSQNGLSGNEPFRLFEDSHGDIWISIISGPSSSNLKRFEPATGKFYAYGQDIALRGDSAPTAFQEDRKGDLWIGFYFGGLSRYRNGKFETFTKADGVPAGLVRALYLDHLGRLWIASAEGGLGRIDDPTQDHPTVAHYTVKEGLSSDQITCITEDQCSLQIDSGVSRGTSVTLKVPIRQSSSWRRWLPTYPNGR